MSPHDEHRQKMTTRLLAVALAVVSAVLIAVLVGGIDVGHGGGKGGGGTTAAGTTTTVTTRPVATPPVDGTWTERGVDFTSYSPDVFPGPAANAQLDRIAATGTKTIAIVVTWYQSDGGAAGPAADPQKSATDDGIRTLAAAAKAKGLTVALKPQVDVLDGTFRGKINPKDPTAWMKTYGDFITHEASLASQIGASTFVVGTELEGLSGRTDDWRALIAQVRQQFGGTLTYAANWVAEAQKVQFWDALDLIGIDAYMPLVKDDPDPTVAELVQGWQQWQSQLQQLNQRWGKPVLFTELGYPSRLGAAQHPSQEGDGAISQPAQARAYEAAFRAWDGVPWFHGIWWWDWPADGGDPATDAGSYSPVGKLAEGTLTRWLAGA